MKEIKIGFIGTNKGMNNIQSRNINDAIIELKINHKIHSARHGDCIGADHEFHDICEKKRIGVYIHPGDVPIMRAFCHTLKSKISKPKPYLDRNKDIVDNSDVIFIIVKDNQKIKDETWYLIDYIKEQNKLVYVFLPNGDINMLNKDKK